MFNVGAMMPWMDYTPRLLDEIIASEEVIKPWFYMQKNRLNEQRKEDDCLGLSR